MKNIMKRNYKVLLLMVLLAFASCSFTSKTLLFDRTHYLNKNYEFHTYLCKTCVGKISDNIRHYILFSKKASSMTRRYKIRNFNRNHLHEVEQSVLPDTSTS